MTASESNLPDDFSDVEEVSRSSGRLRVTLEIAVAILILVGIYYLFAPEEPIDLPPLQQSEIDPIIRAQIDAASVEKAETPPAEAVDGADESQGTPASDPTQSDNTPSIAVADGATARDIIAAQRSGNDSRAVSELSSLARDYQQQGRVTDAYLLWFYAARQGDGDAAFALADLYDPNHFQPGGSLVTAADATQAYKWYSAAARQSVALADERLHALRAALEAKAEAGDMSARRLLLNWQ